MPSTTRFGATLPILAAALVAAPASASDESAQFWMFGSTLIPVSEDVTATAMLFQRFRDESHGGDSQVARTSIDWEASKGVTLGGGLTYVQTATSHQWRTHQQVTLTMGQVSLRSQLEQGMKPGADRTQIRLREKLQTAIRLDPEDRLLLSGEFLYLLQPEVSGEHARVDSLRAAAQLQHRLGKHVDGTLGYMLIVSPRPGEEDQIAHAPQVGLTYRF